MLQLQWTCESLQCLPKWRHCCWRSYTCKSQIGMRWHALRSFMKPKIWNSIFRLWINARSRVSMLPFCARGESCARDDSYCPHGEWVLWGENCQRSCYCYFFFHGASDLLCSQNGIECHRNRRKKELFPQLWHWQETQRPLKPPPKLQLLSPN